MTKINDRIRELIQKNNLIKPLVIVIGFDNQELNQWLMEPINQKLDLIDVEAENSKILPSVLQHLTENNDYYMIRPEEFSLLSEQIKINLIYTNDIIVLRNNLFNKVYPYSKTLSNVQNAFDMLYLNEDTELVGNDRLIIEKINTFYGNINFSKKSGNYFVSYHEELWNDFPQFEFYEMDNLVEIDPVENSDFKINITLDEEELNFLDFEIKKDFSDEVNFIIGSMDQIPNKYIQRISILKSLNPSWKITFSIESIKRQHIERIDDYRSILKDVWGYNDFRDLDMYANIEKRDKKTLKISQAQIIDDIVQQAENARNGNDFRDIYITASTGAGKSVMFQIPTLYLTKKYKEDKPLVLVISPLIGLMNDQVESMKAKNVDNAETINGNTPPYEKQNILHKISEGGVDMLYLSPETLQARSDIKMLIGDRKIAMVIVDEAHIVTTWGKSFRADYWYLGIYLQKLRKEYQFPIVTFTATGIYGGREDMYADTRNSLNMIRPIAYFGLVRRNDITMKIRSSTKEDGDYQKTKKVLALQHLKRAYDNNQKTLMYFPTVKLLNDFYRYLENDSTTLAKKTGKYYGTLSKEEKDTVLEEYKNGELQFVLATKAFGMGIDIPDITNVYHFNPTGNVIDYIQEIGRVARNHSLVSQGYGHLDYLPQDFNAVQQLQGMSAIKKTQIQGVMQKILDIYRSKGNNRNLVVNADDFKYIFGNNTDDDNNLDNKVKTVLLMIEKDFSSSRKLGYSPFVARPRSVFGKEFIMTNKEVEQQLVTSSLRNFFEFKADLRGEGYTKLLAVDLSGIWEQFYKTMSFPEFKYKINTAEERRKMKHARIFDLFNFASGVQYTFDKDNNDKIAGYKKVMEVYQNFLAIMQRKNKQFDVKELGGYLRSYLHIDDEFKARSAAQVLINATFEYQKLKNSMVIRERSAKSKSLFKVIQSGDIFADFINHTVRKLYQPKYNYKVDQGEISVFHYRNSTNNLDEETLVLGIGEAFDKNIGLKFTTLGGYNPQIYIRINSVYPVEQAIKQDQKYRNFILDDVLLKHKIGVTMQKYLFTYKATGQTSSDKIKNYTEWFWNQIEDYFMGKLPAKVEEEVFSKRV